MNKQEAYRICMGFYKNREEQTNLVGKYQNEVDISNNLDGIPSKLFEFKSNAL